MSRQLLVTADDFGIGPETSRGILELAARGTVTSTVLLVNSPYAENALEQRCKAGSMLEVGWHPCLTLDRPVLPAEQIPSLVREDGRFYSLGTFLFRMLAGALNREEILLELTAQYRRFIQFTGHFPCNINGHHHIHIFQPVQWALQQLLAQQSPKPYLRRVRESWSTLFRISGIRLKRLLLSIFGKYAALQQEQAGFAGSDWLLGIADPPQIQSPVFFTNWIQEAQGHLVEMCCHPGHNDVTLLGRDATPRDGQRERRVQEWYRLYSESFLVSIRHSGFKLVNAAEITGSMGQPMRQAA